VHERTRARDAGAAPHAPRVSTLSPVRATALGAHRSCPEQISVAPDGSLALAGRADPGPAAPEPTPPWPEVAPPSGDPGWTITVVFDGQVEFRHRVEDAVIAVRAVTRHRAEAFVSVDGALPERRMVSASGIESAEALSVPPFASPERQARIGWGSGAVFAEGTKLGRYSRAARYFSTFILPAEARLLAEAGRFAVRRGDEVALVDAGGTTYYETGLPFGEPEHLALTERRSLWVAGTRFHHLWLDEHGQRYDDHPPRTAFAAKLDGTGSVAGTWVFRRDTPDRRGGVFAESIAVTGEHGVVLLSTRGPWLVNPDEGPRERFASGLYLLELASEKEPVIHRLEDSQIGGASLLTPLGGRRFAMIRQRVPDELLRGPTRPSPRELRQRRVCELWEVELPAAAP